MMIAPAAGGSLFFHHQPLEAVYLAHGAIASVDHVPVGT
jgi:hypothetical protein